MQRILLKLPLLMFILASCGDDDMPEIQVPETYSFERGEQSTVFFDGQTTRIGMAEELSTALLNFSKDRNDLLEMFRNEGIEGGNVDPFSTPNLNSSTKSIRSKTAASQDYFFSNATTASQIRSQLEDWLTEQANEVFPVASTTLAAPGVAGQIADGSAIRYVNGNGLEYNQLFDKSLIGALMTDQMLNNYLSPAVLDAGDNRALHEAGIPEDGKNYTTMEHKWDEAYGYLYGTSANPENPNETIGMDDNFLNKYVGRVENDPDFTGIADQLFDAFKRGRQAIVMENYTLRDQQASRIQTLISNIIAIRAVYYLQQGKSAIESNSFGAAFHDLSEGYGFIYSLQFTRIAGTNAPYFTHEDVTQLLAELLADGEDGLWDVTPATLDRISERIASKFDFTIAQAGT